MEDLPEGETDPRYPNWRFNDVPEDIRAGLVAGFERMEYRYRMREEIHRAQRRAYQEFMAAGGGDDQAAVERYNLEIERLNALYPRFGAAPDDF
ncbi:hypothetical protein EV193_11175 [Herbihabitans rhizosphaerae]|uniref:Uncharacterized protein n=1 Tax=Herbihabitans rhizosphaerae TaxID=1872711 RepID=A0A4Q7KFN5_9PSEU|nr:hypothetical protein [Herbihabitans rhizosphaerae]RZS32692.1 hypothetical protein EV193_11175 [Herbihabitans rhizosphaerae]